MGKPKKIKFAYKFKSLYKYLVKDHQSFPFGYIVPQIYSFNEAFLRKLFRKTLKLDKH